MKQWIYFSFRKVFSVLTSAVLCLTFFMPSDYVSAENAPELVNNIVLFAQFSSEGNFMNADRTELVINACNGEDNIHTLKSYIDTVSYGRTKTECYFPQLDGDTVQPYVISQPLESYTRESLALEIIKNADIPEDIPLDGNNDGYIDNFIIVIDGTAENRRDTLWPHMSSLAYTGYEINGKKINSFNIHNSGRLFGSVLRPIDVGVLCHEFLHSLGYPDLYHLDSSGETPVGIWDIMALNSWYVQYPLAYMRASRSGWLETADITEDGTYTLSPVAADSGNRVYLLKTPASGTEFFAVEFRQKGANNESMDYICDTGMIIYRVNTMLNGNASGDDEIYIFRPSGSDSPNQANYGGEGRDNFIGSLDPDSGINDGALTYSNGVNSGIRIENITIDGDTLTFDVRFAEIDRQKQWFSVPNDAEIDTAGIPDIDTSDSGIVYLVGPKNDSTSAVLYRISETSCELISEMKVTGSIYEIKLAVAGETPYLLYHDSDYKAVLCSYDISSGEWRTHWKSDSLAQYADIAAKNDTVYFCYTEGAYPSYELHAACYSGGEITIVGDSISKSACDPSLVCTDETVAVAYRDLGEKNIPKLAVREENNWKNISLSDKACSGLSTASDVSTITVAVNSKDAAGLYHYKDNEITFMEYPELPGEAVHARPVYVNGVLMAAIHTQLESDYSLYCYEDGWKKLGGSIESQYVIEPQVTVSGNTIYTVYQLGVYTPPGNPVFIRTLQYENDIPGDVNMDGKFTVADIVLLQKWLLNTPDTELKNPKAADLCRDGKLDVFDLCMMRKLLLQI